MLKDETLFASPVSTPAGCDLAVGAKTGPTLATWRGEFEPRPNLAVAAWKVLISLPVVWRVYLIAICLVGIAVAVFVRPRLFPIAQQIVFLALIPFLQGNTMFRDALDRRRCRELIDRDSTVEQKLVRVRFVRRRVTYGRDIGTLMIVDGMMVFQGLRTHFAVSSEFACQKTGDQNRYPEFGNMLLSGPTFRYVVGGETYFARIEYVLDRNESMRNLNERLSRSKTEEWPSDDDCSGKHSVLPPIDPAPDSYRVTQPWRLAALALEFYVLVMYGLPIILSLVRGAPDTEILLLRLGASLGFLSLAAGLSIYARKADRGIDAMRLSSSNRSHEFELNVGEAGVRGDE